LIGIFYFIYIEYCKADQLEELFKPIPTPSPPAEEKEEEEEEKNEL
jgi:hypothetical protein